MLVAVSVKGSDDIPATSQTPLDCAGPRPQNMSEEDRLSMGLLSLTVRVHLPAWSVEPTHSCCHVEWAETEAAAARRTREVFMVYYVLEEGNEVSDCWIQTQTCSNLRSIYSGTAPLHVKTTVNRALSTARNPLPASFPISRSPCLEPSH